MPSTLLLEALQGKNTGQRPPIWLMRQAGRYLPSYRKIRERHSFLQMCHTPELAVEVTLQPVEQLGVDAAILFSDILLIIDAYGLGLRFEEQKGPIIERALNHPEEVDALKCGSIEEQLGFVAASIKMLRQQLKVPLIGFAGAPFTVVSYMIEGGSSKDLKKTRQWLVRHGAAVHRLLENLTAATIEYLHMQVNAGAQALQLFDTWAGMLSLSQFEEFCVPYMKKIVAALKPTDVPVMLFCKGSSLFAEHMLACQAHGLSIDWHAPLHTVRERIGHKAVLQGNLDPHILYAPLAHVEAEAKKLLASMDKDPGHIFNLGHGLLPDIPVDAVKTLVDTVKNWQGK